MEFELEQPEKLTEKLDMALYPVRLSETELSRYDSRRRQWQGVPGIERAANGRLWATWYSGGATEGNENYVLLTTSMDDGVSWSTPVLVIDPPECVRAFDPVLWHAPDGRLWLFWAQSYGIYDGRCGVWAISCGNSGNANPRWTEPRRLCNGVMMNKPTVLSSGEWLIPAAIWDYKTPKWPVFDHERSSNVFCSTDRGASWHLRGCADVPERAFDEHMIVELDDRRLWMLVRTQYGIGQSFSSDRGRSWTPGEPAELQHLNSRFFIRRLKSGKLLLIKHHGFTINQKDGKPQRSHLCAMLSENDGKSWDSVLMLDERQEVSYPDAIQGDDGMIFIIYDYNRFSDKEILMAAVREEDIIAGKCVMPDSRLRQVVDRAGANTETKDIKE